MHHRKVQGHCSVGWDPQCGMTPGIRGIGTQTGTERKKGTEKEIDSETMTETGMAGVEAEVEASAVAVLLVVTGLLAVAAGMTTVDLLTHGIGRRPHVDETFRHLDAVGDHSTTRGAVALLTGPTTAIRDHSVRVPFILPNERN